MNTTSPYHIGIDAHKRFRQVHGAEAGRKLPLDYFDSQRHDETSAEAYRTARNPPSITSQSMSESPVLQMPATDSGSGALQVPSNSPLSLPLRTLRKLEAYPPLVVSSVGALLIVCIGVLSYLTGPHLSSSLLYLIPLLLVTRVAGFFPGCLAAVLAAAIWLIGDLHSGIPFVHPIIPFWNALMRLGAFVVAVGLVSAMRSVNAHLEERVTERTATLEARMAEKLELEKRILEISDRERATVGQDLHDGLCQHLVGAAFSATMLREELSKGAFPGLVNANRISDMIDDAISQARNLARGLYPVRLETEGLEMALTELASTMSRRFDFDCKVDCSAASVPCNPTADIHLYRIAQEAVTNAGKHAQADQIVILLTGNDSCTRLEIRDNGIGISRAAAGNGSMGLRIMEYRARMIGADFKIESHPASGTKVICEISRQACAPQQHE